jgi:hypothetical protein
MPFLRRILAHESFRAGQYDTDFVRRLMTEQSDQPEASEAPKA